MKAKLLALVVALVVHNSQAFVGRSLFAPPRPKSYLMAHATIYSGEPTKRSKSLNHQDIVANAAVLNTDGHTVRMEQLLQNTAVVVFLRSLG